MTEAVVNKGPEWIQALSQLTPLVAIALLLVAVVALFVLNQRRNQRSAIEYQQSTQETTLRLIESVSKTIVTPIADSQKQSVEEFKRVVSNHMEHDLVSRDAQTRAFTELVACIKERGEKA